MLRDEGEAYAMKLRLAGVLVTAVRYAAIVHDFVVLDALGNTRGDGGDRTDGRLSRRCAGSRRPLTGRVRRLVGLIRPAYNE